MIPVQHHQVSDCLPLLQGLQQQIQGVETAMAQETVGRQREAADAKVDIERSLQVSSIIVRHVPADGQGHQLDCERILKVHWPCGCNFQRAGPSGRL